MAELNRILIVTDDADDANTLHDSLSKAKDGPFDVEWVRSVDDAVKRLRGDGINLVLLDLYMPEKQGRAAFEAVFKAAPSLPIMTIVTEADMGLAQETVESGAQGYLLKDHFHNELVPQALRNVIQRKLVEETLYVERERASVTLESIADAVISTDRDSRVTYLNLAAERMTGWPREEAGGRPIAEVIHLSDAATRQAIDNPVIEVMREKKPVELNANSVLIRRDGQDVPVESSIAPIYDRRGAVTGAVMVFRNTGPTQTLMTAKMTYLAQHDALTDLPNRILLADRLAQAIASAKRYGKALAVFFLDLDHFKHINDSLGHSIGDQLLQSVARRLASSIRAADTVSRYGGDEFIIVSLEDGRHEEGFHLADKVLATLALPHPVAQHKFHTSASMGISVYPQDGQDAESLIKNADIAMYHAKQLGGNHYLYFNAEMNRRAVERHSIEAGLHRALEARQFVLHYQPKVQMQSGVITGVEALLRWRHPERGCILPYQFISIAEESGLIVPIGRWVLREACRQAKLWNEQAGRPLSVAVNVSALEFRSMDYLENVRQTLGDSGLAPELLELELTESLVMSNSRSNSAMLKALKEIGVKLAVDDFGTGYSSLTYLQEFPLDILKIDQSFVRGIADADRDRVIVKSVIGMGANLRHSVVAEGIETQEQVDFLNSQQCDEGQGFFFSVPLDSERCTRLIDSGLPLRP